VAKSEIDNNDYVNSSTTTVHVHCGLCSGKRERNPRIAPIGKLDPLQISILPIFAKDGIQRA
jgi:hypothetical protein